MFPDINNFLDIDGNSDFCQQFIGISDSKADGSFLIHYFLSIFLRQGRKVCFIGLQQSLNHYSTLLMKFGLNLNKFRESHQLIFIEGLKCIGDSIACHSHSEGKHPEEKEYGKIWSNSLVHSLSMKGLLLYIIQIIEHSEQVNTQLPDTDKPIIILDDIGVLLSLGVPVTELLAFIHYLKSEIVFNKGGSVVLYLHGNKSSGDEDEMLGWKTMCHSCNIQLEVTRLSSGYCKEVQGEISLTRRHGDHQKGHNSYKKIQYHLTDKSVVCFAVGMSSVVL